MPPSTRSGATRQAADTDKVTEHPERDGIPQREVAPAPDKEQGLGDELDLADPAAAEFDVD